MRDMHDYLATAVEVIKADSELTKTFNNVLQYSSSSRLVSVNKLLISLEKTDAPKDLKDFVKLLSNERLAHQFLKAINT